MGLGIIDFLMEPWVKPLLIGPPGSLGHVKPAMGPCASP